MDKIDLQTIFGYLVNDHHFLTTVIEPENTLEKQKQASVNKSKLMIEIVSDYVPLSPGDTQTYAALPDMMKPYLSPDFVRLGIRSMGETTDTVAINISFLHALNILLRPELCKSTDSARDLSLLEYFISHKIQRNFQIDKVKNTTKIQQQNKEHIKNLSRGKITPPIIQYVVNIFEINILVFDLTQSEVHLYWTHGYKYPYLNLFKKIHCMVFVQGNYEPVTILDQIVSLEQMQKNYIQILLHMDNIICIHPPMLNINMLLYFNTWPVHEEYYIAILEKFYGRITDTENLMTLLAKYQDEDTTAKN